ncbi:MAG: hypothetical protein Q7R80_02490, partial [bacterium]|nr:hypothetical protein [bacterium]
TRDGNLTASGNVRGSQLCIGGDCKSSWDAVAPSSVLLQDATPGTAQTGHFNLSGTGRVGSLVVNGGITAGGSVGIVGANGKIPAINSTYFTSLTGTSLVALNASNLAIGTVPDARLPSGLLQNPIDGGSGNVGPWLTIQGGGAVLSNTSLRLYDAGTAAANANILEFAHNGGSGPVAIARVKSANVDANAANGGVLALETASNNAGVWNAGQLTLYNNGRVGVGLTPGGPTPSERLHVGGKVYANDGVTIGASGTVNLQGGDIINADVIIGGADTATQPFLQFVSGYLKLKPSNVAWGLVVGNSDPAIPGGFAHFWHDGTSVVFNDGTSNPAQGMKLNGNDLTVSNTITAGNDLAVVDNVTVGGDVTVTGDIDAKNSFECVNVGTELRCNLREFWRT